MAELPAHLRQVGHITRQGDRVTLTIRADGSAYLAVLQNHGPAWDRLLELQAALARSLEGSALLHYATHHLPEEPRISAMHAAYDRRRRARRRR